jgi:hypothetical protein
MPFKKQAAASIVSSSLTQKDWEELHGKKMFKGCGNNPEHKFCKVANDHSLFLLSHCTIMASVMTEPEPFDYWIKPETAHFVNNNGDSWSNEVLKLSYKTFVGAFNFVEHFQNSKASKGHILDAILRKVAIAPPDIWVYYVDILVATDLAHTELVTSIKSGKTQYLSMGCSVSQVQCSYCGATVLDGNDYCTHLKFQKGSFLTDPDGIPRRIAELCGHKSLPGGGVQFVEASWVKTPAFPGAAKQTILAEEWVGPKTRYTQKAANQNLKKTASSKSETTDYLSEASLRANLKGKLI